MAIIAPEVSPEPIPGVHDESAVTPTALGAGPGAAEAGQEVQQIAKETGDISTFERIRFDQTAVQEAKAKLSASYSDLLYNPENGVLASHGLNALQAQQKASGTEATFSTIASWKS